jgi:hypothetical protein
MKQHIDFHINVKNAFLNVRLVNVVVKESKLISFKNHINHLLQNIWIFLFKVLVDDPLTQSVLIVTVKLVTLN